MGDTVQSLHDQDKAFTTPDKGNDQESSNVKALPFPAREIDEWFIPAPGQAPLRRLVQEGGHLKDWPPPQQEHHFRHIWTHRGARHALFPENGRTLFITASMYKALKENPDFLGVDKLGEAALAKGQVGEIDGMKVIKVLNSYFPAGVYWLITHKSAVLGPAKLQDYKIHKDPPGINGDLVEAGVLHDAFVLEARKNAVYVAANAAKVANDPVITKDAANGIFNRHHHAGSRHLLHRGRQRPAYCEHASVYGGNVNYAAAGYGANTVYVRTLPTLPWDIPFGGSQRHAINNTRYLSCRGGSASCGAAPVPKRSKE
jgi:hypothetical protein